MAAFFCIGFVGMGLRRAHYTQMASSVTTIPTRRARSSGARSPRARTRAGAAIEVIALRGSASLLRAIDARCRIVFEPPQVLFDAAAGASAPQLVFGPVQLGRNHLRGLPHPAIGRIKAGADQGDDDELGHGFASRWQLETEARPQSARLDGREDIIGQGRGESKSFTVLLAEAWHT